MTPVVVDSSIAVKWFVLEVLSAEAIRLRDSGQPLQPPRVPGRGGGEQPLEDNPQPSAATW
jgi:hypothetical protein